jgi:group I intron endonuclease
MTGIYKIESKIHPDRIYIGSSIDIRRRWENHRYELKKNIHASNKFQNHYNKYGASDLIYTMIESCESNKLIEREQYYIDTLKPFFNNRIIANSQLGIKRSEETKRKLSESRQGWYVGEKNPNYGRKHTEEEKQKMRDAHINRIHHKHTEDWKKAASERMKEINNPNYNKSTWIKGKHLSEETKLKLSFAKKGKPSKTKGIKKPPTSVELKLKRSIQQRGARNSFYGKRHTEETKAKIRASWIIRKLKKTA